MVLLKTIFLLRQTPHPSAEDPHGAPLSRHPTLAFSPFLADSRLATKPLSPSPGSPSRVGSSSPRFFPQKPRGKLRGAGCGPGAEPAPPRRPPALHLPRPAARAPKMALAAASLRLLPGCSEGSLDAAFSPTHPQGAKK